MNILFLDASALGFAQEHAGILLTILGIMWTLLLVAVSGGIKYVRGEFTDLHAADVNIDRNVTKVGERVSAVENEFGIYKERMGAGDKHFGEISGTIKDLSSQFQIMQLDNQKAHADIIQGRQVLADRVTRVEDSIEGLKSKMPNGELAMMNRKIDALLETLGKK